MRIAICDDEKEYRDLLFEHLNFFFTEYHIKAELCLFGSGDELVKDGGDFDIAFLDIEMDDINGIAAARELLKRKYNTIIFIVTAYSQYLDDAMDLKVFRYIDKPVSSKRIYDGLRKAVKIIDESNITFKTDVEYIRIPKNNIIYVEACNKKVSVVTTDKTYVTTEKIDFFKDALTASYFAVPHNSFIVNMKHIAKYKRNELLLDNGYSILIAQKKQHDMKSKYLHFIKEG